MTALKSMPNNWKVSMTGAILLMLVVLAIVFTPARGAPPMVMSNLPADAHVSVMTYNVEGLPVPARFGRSSSLAQIGERLREMRVAGKQPHIVVLQEAFSDAAKQIGVTAGYRYIAHGPSADMPASDLNDSAEKELRATTSFWKGEGVGKFLDSGLMVLSDYPIVSVRRVAYPSCAGYDCMANKGAMMAFIAIPGIPTPVAVVDTHLNARAASHADFGRSLMAYKEQVATLGRFIQGNLAPNAPLIIAGDFNVGKDRYRSDYLEAQFAHWWNGSTSVAIKDSLTRCAAGEEGCDPNLSADAAKTFRRRKDWQISAPALASAMLPRAVSVPFGRESDGSMLSDHMGYVVHYRWATQAPRRS